MPLESNPSETTPMRSGYHVYESWSLSAAAAICILFTIGPAFAESGSADRSVDQSRSASNSTEGERPQTGAKGSDSNREDRSRERDNERADPRGKLGAEVGGGIAGLFGGFLGAGIPSFLIGVAAYPDGIDDMAGATTIGLGFGFIGGSLGAVPGAGWGASLAGDASGGTGSTGFAILGSVIGGVGGVGTAVLAGEAVRNLGPAQLGVEMQLYGGLLAGATAAVTGGVLGYRWSAEPDRAEQNAVQWAPYLRTGPRANGGEFGIRLRF